MPKRPKLLDRFIVWLVPLGPVEARAMFGGWGMFLDGVMFALMADDAIYLRADDDSRGDFEALGLTPFRPWPEKPMTMPYYPLPEGMLDDVDKLRDWSGRAIAAARRAKAAKGSPKRRPRRQPGDR